MSPSTRSMNLPMSLNIGQALPDLSVCAVSIQSPPYTRCFVEALRLGPLGVALMRSLLPLIEQLQSTNIAVRLHENLPPPFGFRLEQHSLFCEFLALRTQ